MAGEWKTYPTGNVRDWNIDLEIRHWEPGQEYPPKEHPPQMRADVRRDGCVHLQSFSNGADPEQDTAERVAEDTDYMHICDLEQHIRRMQELLEKARAHFGARWPEE